MASYFVVNSRGIILGKENNLPSNNHLIKLMPVDIVLILNLF